MNRIIKNLSAHGRTRRGEKLKTGNWKLKTVFILFVLLVMALPAGASTIDLPRTGQTTCYDAAGAEIACVGTGQDGAIQAGVEWPNPRFTDNGDQTIADNLTGLVWTKDAGTPTAGSCTGGTKTWQGALDYVACLNTNNYLSHNDWRLPQINELESLVDASKYSPALPEGHPFTNVQSSYYWSSSTYAVNTGRAWSVYVHYGGVDGNDKSYGYYYVWPVRAGQSGAFGNSYIWKTGQTASYATGDDGDLEMGVAWPSPRFTDNGNGTVTDNLTGLIWLKNANCFGTKIWNDALTAANTLANSQCGLSDGSSAGDWRLPNRKELMSLIDRSKYNSALPAGHPFTNVQSYFYWSSSTHAGYTGVAWSVYMSNGVVDGYGESSYDFVWPVRGGTVTGGDTTPPTTTASPSGGIYGSAQSVTLTCSDGTGSGCKTTNYCLGSGCTPVTAYTTPISISNSTDLRFYSIDFADNSEAIKTETYTISATTVNLPRTGQTTSYAAGDDGAIQAGVAWPSPRFTDNSDQTITDNLTGLVWTKNANLPGATKTWQQALDYVSGMNAGTYTNYGYTDWRLPNVNELESLVNKSQTNNSTWLNSQGFINVQSQYYWSSTTDAQDTGRAWRVHMWFDYPSSVKSDSSFVYMWPVRSGQSSGIIELAKTGQTTSYATGDDGDLEKGLAWPSPRFVDNGNGTVTDNLTGLIWLKNANCFGTKTWNDALSTTNSLANGQCGLSDSSQAGDWRLPNIKELMSLIDRSQYNPALPGGHPFTNVQLNYYWSATTSAYDTLSAWNVVMTNGIGIYNFKSTNFYLWPVRDGTVADTTPPTGTISINSGATYTNTTSVTLTLSCTDGSGCAEMQFSNDNVTYSTAETYATSKTWTLSSGDGTKTVYAKFKDTAGNWSSAYSDTIVLDTTVSAPSNIEANQNGNKGELVITWTKPADSDFNHIHIYRSTTSGVLGSLIADNQTGIKYTDTGLASQTTYYYTVRAVDNLGNESTNTKQYSGTTLDATPPGVPSNITATDAGTGGKINLSWTNPSDSDFSHIHIYRSTSSGSLGSLVYDNVTGTSKSDTGLTNGLTYYYVIRSVDTSGNESTNTLQISAAPTAPDVTAPGAVSSVVISDPAIGGVLNLSWTNPADSDFAKVRIYRSTIEGQLGSLVHEITGTSVSDTGLTSNTTYYYTFHTVDNLGNESSHTTQYSGMPTDIVAPNPVTELTATLLNGGKVQIDWIRSSSEDINYYNIYYDNGTGTIDYTTAIATIQHPTVTWTSDALTVGTRYQFAIRAEDTSFNKETNTNVISVVPVTDPNAGDVSASIKVPQTGKKVCGNMVTVMAELIMGTVADTQKVRLQYKTVASGTWSDIPSTDPAKFPNPDTTSPYFVHWNVTTLADGDYNLRAVATSNALVTDLNPSYITITVDSVNCSSQETTNAGGEKTKAEDVSENASSNSVMAGSTGVTTVSLPEGSLDADTKINITESDPATKAGLVPSGYSNGSSFNEIGFESGQTTLANNKKATIEIPYKDNDNNGIVDGTSVKVYDLQVCDYNSGTGKWTCLDSLVDTDKKTVKAKTEKFSLFGLLMPPKPVGAEWNLLSVPLQPSPNTPSAVFGSVTSYPGYILWWDPSTGAYKTVSTINTGKSYWVWGNGSNLGTVSGTETPNTNFSISIKKGWNMIGHPFRYKVKVSDLWVYYGGNYYTIQDAETNGWVVATVYKYENGAYQFQSAQDGGVLEAWKGYWILSDIDCTLIIPPTPVQ